MAARVAASGRVYQLDRPAEPDELVTEEDARDPSRIARLFGRLLRDVATLKRRSWPRRIDFEDREVASGDVMRLNHGFGARVRFWVVDWRPTTPGDPALFERNADTNAETLCLDVGNSGTVTIRIEVA